MLGVAVIGCIILFVRSSYLFSRYNAPSIADRILGDSIPRYERKEIDDFKLSCFAGIVMSAKGLSVLVLGIGAHLFSMWIVWFGAGAYIFITLAYIIYIRFYIIEGTHFRKK